MNADGRDAIEALIGWHVEGFGSVETERDIDTLSTQTLKTTSDQALFLELAMRGYDLAALRNMQQVVSMLGNGKINHDNALERTV